MVWQSCGSRHNTTTGLRTRHFRPSGPVTCLNTQFEPSMAEFASRSERREQLGYVNVHSVVSTCKTTQITGISFCMHVKYCLSKRPLWCNCEPKPFDLVHKRHKSWTLPSVTNFARLRWHGCFFCLFVLNVLGITHDSPTFLVSSVLKRQLPCFR